MTGCAMDAFAAFSTAPLMFSRPRARPSPVNSPVSIISFEGECTFRAELTADAAAAATLWAAATTAPRMALMPLTRPCIMLVPAPYRLTDAKADRMPLAALCAALTA